MVLENTVNKGGGKCYRLEDIAPVHHLCVIKGIKLHLDGARIFNALVATGDHARDYGQYFNGISVCLSKGLGAPVGSVLLGSKETIYKARRIRKVLGGGMRQAGFLAAAGIYALDHHVNRLAEDHSHAKVLASALQSLNFVESVMPVETNIVLFDVVSGLHAEQVVKYFAQKGLYCNATSAKTIRLVTHLDIAATQVDQALQIFSTFHF
ncbi:L-allo-threonine aldolase [compost metagenome]